VDAIVLVGGQGIRLRPLTLTRHKSLVPVCNRPVIAYLFDWLARSGFDRAVLAIGRDNEDLAEAFPPGRIGALELVHVLERERLQSGGAIRNAVKQTGIEGRFTVLNGDIFVDFDFARALEAHDAARADLTLALYEMDDPSPFGVAAIDAASLVTGFVEKPPRGSAPSNLVNAGVWIFEPGLVAEIPPGAVSVEETLFPSLVARRRPVLGYRFEGLWADVGAHARYLELNQELVDAAGHSCLADDASIAPGATVARSSVGAGTHVGAGATVQGSILWEHVQVGDEAVVDQSVIADGAVVERGARVTGAIVGSGAVIAAGSVVRPGTSIAPRERYHVRNDR
jgi:mannose-1-phosphate guanylyltransferase